MTVRWKVLGGAVLGAVVGLGLLLGWLLGRRDRLRMVPRSEEVPSRLAAVADRDGTVFGVAWVHDPAQVLDLVGRTTGLRSESPTMGLVLGSLAADAVLFGLREPRHPRGWTVVAFLRASPAMERGLPWVRRFLPPPWQWQDRPASPGCARAFDLEDAEGRLPGRLVGQFCGGYLVLGEADPEPGFRLWQTLRATAGNGPRESQPGASPPAVVLWLRPDRLPETLRRALPAEVRTWVDARVPVGQWVTLAVSGEAERLEVRAVFPMVP